MSTIAQCLFISTLIGGSLISISANSWFSAWMGLEINLLSFIPLMSNPKNTLSNEAALKYFLVQALASITFLFTTTFMQMYTLPLMNNLFTMLTISTLLMKMGAAPFHFWFPGIMEGLNWKNCFILMTWQKIAPLVLLSYLVKMNLFTLLIVILSIIVGSLGGLNQTSLRKLLAYSSINHLGWMIAAMFCGENLWELYFLTYSLLTLTLIYMFSILSVFHFNQNFMTINNSQPLKLFLFLTLLSLGGLPPFLGFLPKWIVIQSLISLNLYFICFIMILMTLITLFYYIRLSFTALLITYPQMKYKTTSMKKITLTIPTTLMSFSLLTLPLCTLIYNCL
uniref:NADH-ubiquinone oxidoreductase chain 2 n=1 Tax=Furcilarnaca wufengensis TaxID=2982682 RepID=A0A977XMA1_9ORTH|nr:NADH dehydrogenase subunit 2 [Furcilarnaca wufengensis]UXP34253.1 NADH dehydrogenase subunit 2 [Furcilarnaca wufengensis]UXP34335.1 NADH dehydrogenase subunit 2 [Furcilarnaca wufengensis]